MLKENFEVWYETKDGEKFFKLSPRQLGINKKDCFVIDLLEQMAIHRLTFVSNIGIILDVLPELKIPEKGDLFLLKNNDGGHFVGYKIYKKNGDIICCPEEQIEETYVLSSDEFIFQKKS